MLTAPGLSRLRERKRELLLESELNRQTFRVEFGRLHCGVEEFRRGYRLAQGAWWGIASVAGLFAAFRFRKRAGVFGRASLLARLLRSAWNIWEALRRRDRRPPENSPA